MRAGILRNLVEMQEPVVVRDSFGEADKQWRSVGRVWAAVRGLPGRETLQAQQVFAERMYIVTIRGVFPTLRAGWRIVLENGTLLDITSVADAEGRGRSYELLAKEVAA